MKINVRKIFTIGVILGISGLCQAEDAPVVDAYPSGDTPHMQGQQALESGDAESTGTEAKTGNAYLLGKISDMQKEIQELRGKLEEQSHDLKVLSDQQKSFYKDFDGRLNKLPASAEKSSPPASSAAEDSEPAKPAAAKPVANKAGSDEEAKYNQAYELITEKNYVQATKSMQAFLKEFPSSKYSANGHYWLGELHSVQGNTDKAIAEFKIVSQNYPQSPKAPSALLKLGYAFYDQGKLPVARQQLDKLLQKYPNTPTARLAQAKIAEIDQKGQ